MIERLYNRLDAKERTTALLAAMARGDETEQQRLGLSAPQTANRVGHHSGRVRASWVLSALARISILERIADYWCAMAFALAAEGEMTSGTTSDDSISNAADAERRTWKAIADATIATLKRDRESWRLACEELGIPAEFENVFAGNSFASAHTLQGLEANTPSSDELRAALRELGGENVTPAAADPSGWLATFRDLIR